VTDARVASLERALATARHELKAAVEQRDEAWRLYDRQLFPTAAEMRPKLAAAEAESSRLSREVEGLRSAVFWAMGWRRYVERYICLHGHPASSRFRRSRDRLARVLSGGAPPSSSPRDPHVCDSTCPGEPHDAIGAGAKGAGGA
jgi:hypothetical protein